MKRPQSSPFLLLLLAASLFLMGHANAADHISWRKECSGRMQIELPGEVDIAATTPADQKLGLSPPAASFANGQRIKRIRFSYRGSIEILHTMPQDELDEYLNSQQIKVRRRFEKYERRRDTHREDQYVELETKPQRGTAYDAQNLRAASIRLKSSIFQWNSDQNRSISERKGDFRHILDNLTDRDKFQVPTKPGVCFPYAFIHDNNKQPLMIVAGYRLREHPDITVVLSESKAAKYDNKIREIYAQPDTEISEFWRYFSRRLSRERVRSVWEFPILRPIQLGGQNGLAAFVKIFRADSTADYGYTAVVRGDPASPLDHPDLAIYIIQANANARSMAMRPLNKQEFLAFAERIADSVKPHYKEAY